jgi:hypothetical protein
MAGNEVMHTPGPEKFKGPFRCMMHKGEWPSKDLPWIIKDIGNKQVALVIAPQAAERQEVAQWICDHLNAHDDLVEALKATVEAYCDLANSGDCGFWDPEITDEVKQARAALRKALSPSVPEVK